MHNERNNGRAGTGVLDKECGASAAMTSAQQFMDRNPAYSTALKFAGEYVPQMDSQFHKNRFQFVQGKMMLAMLNAEQRLMGNANFPRELRVRKAAPFFSQEFRQLLVQVVLHNLKSGKNTITYA
jgi:hypothetical protein